MMSCEASSHTPDALPRQHRGDVGDEILILYRPQTTFVRVVRNVNLGTFW